MIKSIHPFEQKIIVLFSPFPWKKKKEKKNTRRVNTRTKSPLYMCSSSGVKKALNQRSIKDSLERLWELWKDEKKQKKNWMRTVGWELWSGCPLRGTSFWEDSLAKPSIFAHSDHKKPLLQDGSCILLVWTQRRRPTCATSWFSLAPGEMRSSFRAGGRPESHPSMSFTIPDLWR